MTKSDLWTYESSSWRGDELVGYDVEGLDGRVGSVDEATRETPGYLVVDTGPWMFGKKVVLPAGVVDRTDSQRHTIFVHRTRAEIENGPEYDEESFESFAYRAELGRYYGPGGPGYRKATAEPTRPGSA